MGVFMATDRWGLALCQVEPTGTSVNPGDANCHCLRRIPGAVKIQVGRIRARAATPGCDADGGGHVGSPH